jgi:hypothetical protein
MRCSILALALLVGAGACGGDGGDGNAPDGGGSGNGDGGSGGGADGASDGASEGWVSLISGEWTLPAGDEGYVCVRKTMSETLFVTAFRPLIPNGTHHTVLTVGPPAGPDGTFPCGVGTNAARMIFGSGVGTTDLYLPEGVGMRIDAGQQLNLNLHLYNFDDLAAISGTSGTEVQLATAVANEAEVVLAGPTFFSIDSTHTVIEGDCTMNGDVTLFAASPHMHQLGRHMTVTTTARTIMDRDYSFDEQTVELLTPLSLPSGTQVHVACTYADPGGGVTVSYGDSTDAEMCFAGLFRYPVRGGFLCSD